MKPNRIIWGHDNQIPDYKWSKYDKILALGGCLGFILMAWNKEFYTAFLYGFFILDRFTIKKLDFKIKKQSEVIIELREYEEIFVDSLNNK